MQQLGLIPSPEQTEGGTEDRRSHAGSPRHEQAGPQGHGRQGLLDENKDTILGEEERGREETDRPHCR
jgi:hypothetical protein